MLYLPSYSPDLNPIEPFLTKLKALLRKVPPAPRRRSGMPSAVDLDEFTPEECQNYLAHCGYEL